MQKEIIKKYKEKGLIVPGVYDKVFKAIMQDNTCREYLIEILFELTKLPKEYIKENLIIKNSELPLERLKEKQKITDIIVEIQNNIINLEMNNFYYKGLIERNDMYLNELRKLYFDKDYTDIPKIIQINFNNFKKHGNRSIMKFVIMDEETHIKETEYYEKYHIYLKRINEKYYNNEKLIRLEKLMLLLILDKKEELEKVLAEDEVMKSVGEKIITLSEDSAMILCYDEEEHKENVRRAVTKTEIEEAVSEAKEKAIKEGIKEGKKVGIKEGRQKGIEEVAKNLIKENVDINIVLSATGLTVEELKKIKNEK